MFYRIPRGVIYYLKLRVRVIAMREIATFEGVQSSNTLWHVQIMFQECAEEESVAVLQDDYIICVHNRSTLH